jgi:hypothetical protein
MDTINKKECQQEKKRLKKRMMEEYMTHYKLSGGQSYWDDTYCDSTLYTKELLNQWRIYESRCLVYQQ